MFNLILGCAYLQFHKQPLDVGPRKMMACIATLLHQHISLKKGSNLSLVSVGVSQLFPLTSSLYIIPCSKNVVSVEKPASH